MATSVKSLSCFFLRPSSRIPLRRRTFTPIATTRNIHGTYTFRRNVRENDLEDDAEDESEDRQKKTPQKFVFDVASLSPEERNTYDHLSPEEKLQYEEEGRKFHEHMNSPATVSSLTAAASTAAYEVSQEIYPEDFRLPRIKPGYMAEGEEDEQGTGEDDDFQGDDITATAHGELEQHREMREYARIAAWEMPLLSKFARPFQPPPRDRPLRFRYTTYMGETHPAEKKIVVEFCTRDLRDLTEPQRIKLIKIVGPRYNPETDTVKMSCEMFETQAQNKRYLGDLVDTLMAEAKDSSDMFEDVPLDFRHHRFKRRIVFPESWKMTGKRKREQIWLSRGRTELNEQVVDGVEEIENWLKEASLKEPNPVFVGGKAGPTRGIGQRRAPRRPIRTR